MNLRNPEINEARWQWLEYWPEAALLADADGNLLRWSQRAADLLGLDESRRGRDLHHLLCSIGRSYAHEPLCCPLFKGPVGTLRSDAWQTVSGEQMAVDYRLLQPEIPGTREARYLLCFHPTREQAFNQQELHKLARYVASSPMPMGEFDAAGQLIFANPALQRLLVDGGFDEDGNACALPTGIAGLCEQCIYGEREQQAEVTCNDRYFSWQFYPAHVDEQPLALGYAVDVTETRRLQQLLEAQQRRQRRDYYARMIHELRTPLNAIIGFSQLLLNRYQNTLPKQDAGSLQAIRSAGLNLSDLINDTLDLARIESGRMKLRTRQFELEPLCANALSMLAPLAAERGIDLNVRCEPGLVMASDEQKVRQILVNLCANAIKFTSEGQVDVHAAAGLNEPDKVVIRVRDTGAGIALRDLEAVFQPFEQAGDSSGSVPGTGLGLALVKELAQLLGGDIHVSSTPGEGSEFCVVLARSLSDV